jgi:branched-chain amino acid transport system substrate-binding protein
MDERKVCIKYYLEPNNPRVFDGVPDDLRNNIIEQYNDKAFPFDRYLEYESFVKQQVSSGQRGPDQIRDSLSSDERRLLLYGYEVNAIIDRGIEGTIIVPPLLTPEKFIQKAIRTICQWIRRDRYIKYVLLALFIIVALVLIKNLILPPHPIPETSPSPVNSPTTLGRITDDLEDMPIKSANLKNLVAKNNAIAKGHPGKYRTIVASVPISGKSVNNATEILRGISLAQDKQNQKNNPKFYLFLKIADDGNDPETAKNLAAKFVEDSEILGVIGHNSSGSSVEAAPEYIKNHLVMISPTSSANDLTKDNSGYIYRVVQTDSESVRRLAKYIKKPGKNFQKVYICVAKDDRGNWAKNADSFTTAFVEEMNGQANFDYQCSLPVSNGTSVKVDDQQKLIKEKFTKDNYNSLLLAASTDTKFASWKLAEIFKESGFNKKGLFGNDSLNTDIQSDISWASVQGIDNRLTLVAPWHQENSNGYVQNYVNSYKAKFIGEKDGLNWRSAMAYDATLALMAALDTLNFSSDQDIHKNREAVSDALKNVVIPADQAATGTVRFTEKGDRDISASPNLVGYIVQAKKTGWCSESVETSLNETPKFKAIDK